mmetsp:Transcript_100528/g.181443  ORF Transcript_100528/g.181443 Transcript_100528/m.181443 type:complete len:311 (+) Transcript_100528:593-1525(+)
MSRRGFDVLDPLFLLPYLTHLHLVLDEVQVHMITFALALDLFAFLIQAVVHMACLGIFFCNHLLRFRLHGHNVTIHGLFVGDLFLELRGREPPCGRHQRRSTATGHEATPSRIGSLLVVLLRRRIVLLWLLILLHPRQRLRLSLRAAAIASANRRHAVADAEHLSLRRRVLRERVGGLHRTFVGSAVGSIQALLGVDVRGEGETWIPITSATEPTYVTHSNINLLSFGDDLSEALHNSLEHGEDLVFRQLLRELDRCLAEIEVLEGTKVTLGRSIMLPLGLLRQVGAHELVGELEERFVRGLPGLPSSSR